MTLLVQFIGRVVAFALRGSVQQTNNWQVVAGGTALPSIGLGVIFGLAGRRAPMVEPSAWATYFGYGLLTWLALRFVAAPFFIWREQYEETAALRLELSKPERLVLAHLTKHRAKARARLASELEDFQTLAFSDCWGLVQDQSAATHMVTINRLVAEAGLSKSFHSGKRKLLVIVQEEGKIPNHRLAPDRKSADLLRSLQIYLVGDITAEELALRLPASLAVEKLP